jgi:xylan 1,4-beta-xylosidase
MRADQHRLGKSASWEWSVCFSVNHLSANCDDPVILATGEGWPPVKEASIMETLMGDTMSKARNTSTIPILILILSATFLSLALPIYAQENGKKTPAVVASGETATTTSASDTGIRITAQTNKPGKPLVHYWSKVVGAGRANEGLRASWQEELEAAARYDGFQYVRFHGLFHDDMFVYREDERGNPIYNFQYVDDVFDRMLGKGVRPFVELSFVPRELAVVKNTTFWWQANGSPPSDYNKWAALVGATVEHWVSRYGAEEVRRWYFEVWNEPNLTDSFFRGTQPQYFELYKITAQTIKKIDTTLRVGGPATSNFEMDREALAKAQASGKPFDPMTIPWRPVWIEEFLAYCKTNNLPVDFISTHPYPQDFVIDERGKDTPYRRSIDSTRDDLRTIRRVVDASPYPHAEIHLTEWNSSPSPTDHTHDSLAAAAFIVKTNLESIGLVDSLSYWVFTDVFEENRNTDSIFHGGFGLINYQEIVKPAFHAYRFLNELGDELLEQTVGGVVTRDKATGRITALAYNYPVEEKSAIPLTDSVAAADALDARGSARELEINLHGLPAGTSFLIETLDREHGNAVVAWESMGMPEPPNQGLTKLLREAAWDTKKEIVRVDRSGNLEVRRQIAPWSLVLVKEF